MQQGLVGGLVNMKGGEEGNGGRLSGLPWNGD